jgi:hypothetical protein
MTWTPDYQFRASYVLSHLRSFTQMNFREFVAAHESVCGTFETCRRSLTMSVYWGRPEVIGRLSKRRV